MPRAPTPPPVVEEVVKRLSDDELRQELDRRRKLRVEKLQNEAKAENAYFFDHSFPQVLSLTQHVMGEDCSDDNYWNTDHCLRCELLEFQNQGFIDVEKRIEVEITVKERSWNV